MLRHARRDQHRGERCGPCPAGADRGGSEQPAEARLAGADHPGDGGGLRHGGDHAPGRGVQALRLALAGALHGAPASAGCCATRPASPASRRCRRPWSTRVVDADLGDAAGRGDALDRPRDGRGQPASRSRSVQRIWAAHGLQPHRVRTFKLSSDPAFAAKLADIVGLYVDPPAPCRGAVGRREEPCVDGPRLARGKLSVWRDQVACGHVSGLLTRSSHDRWPRWVPRTGASSDPRDSRPSTSPGFSRSVGATDHPITFLPSQASRGRRARPMPGLPADSSAPAPSPPRRCAPSCWPEQRRPRGGVAWPAGPGSTHWPGCLRAQQGGLRADDQQAADVLVAEPADPAQPLLAAGGVSAAARGQARPRTPARYGRPSGSGTVAAMAVAISGPMPGMVASRRLTGLALCQAMIRASTSAIRCSTSSS